MKFPLIKSYRRSCVVFASAFRVLSSIIIEQYDLRQCEAFARFSRYSNIHYSPREKHRKIVKLVKIVPSTRFVCDFEDTGRRGEIVKFWERMKTFFSSTGKINYGSDKEREEGTVINRVLEIPL